MAIRHVAVLGAGIMGASTALLLAQRGIRVVVFDAACRPLDRASRWNEGKIHLGFLYARDQSLRTARRLLAGGLSFKPLVEQLIGESIDQACTESDDTYLVHRDSVVSASEVAGYFEAVTRLIAGQPQKSRYLTPLDTLAVTRLTERELNRMADCSQVVAGFRVPERSVQTGWLADRIAAALSENPAVELRLNVVVGAVSRTSDGRCGVVTSEGGDGPFDAVVNALWEGRLAVDASVGIPLPPAWSHRYRLSCFVRTTQRVGVPSVVVCTGPFGDVKNYDGKTFYVSWYPDGLQVDTSVLKPTDPSPLVAAERRRLAASMRANLATCVPWLQKVWDHAETCSVDGGWVFAVGTGSLADPESALHRRDQIGVSRDGRYISVDTGKYSIAPWLARQIVDQVAG